MANEQSERLANMKQYLAMEKADPDGSPLYIADLEQSIERLEKQIKSGSKYLVMNTHNV